jgi:hypothetical protein
MQWERPDYRKPDSDSNLRINRKPKLVFNQPILGKEKRQTRKKENPRNVNRGYHWGISMPEVQKTKRQRDRKQEETQADLIIAMR